MGALVTPSQSPITTVGRATSSTRSRSHSGRSHRNGRTHAPAFHAPYMATTWATEFGNAVTTVEPWPTP